MDVDTFFDLIRQKLIDLMNRELADLGSARVQTTAWIRFRTEVEDKKANVICYPSIVGWRMYFKVVIFMK